eukprot:jgi/Botrbrau1/134/Bobra.0022s0120.1
MFRPLPAFSFAFLPFLRFDPPPSHFITAVMPHLFLHSSPLPHCPFPLKKKTMRIVYLQRSPVLSCLSSSPPLTFLPLPSLPGTLAGSA